MKKQEDLLAEFISMGRDVVREGKKLLLELGVAETAQAEADDWVVKKEKVVDKVVDKVVAKKVEKEEGEDPYAGYKKVLTGGVRKDHHERVFVGEKKLVLKVSKIWEDVGNRKKLEKMNHGEPFGELS